MNMRPILDRIIVRRDATKDVTKGGIIIPDVARELSLEGEVIAVGPGRPLDSAATGA
jgi:chaperonin GroES